uniref:ethanolamine kinase n=1 Tax=Kalanchoe fedtschenkoi TaxID=63787 RepID=A0A7N0TRI6_KALFE
MAAEEARRQSSLTVDTHVSLLELKPHIISLCKDLFKKWSELNQSRFSVERISGGMTNLLLKVSVEDETGNAESFAVRLYGPNTEYVINRERELLVRQI